MAVPHGTWVSSISVTAMSTTSLDTGGVFHSSRSLEAS